MDTPVPFSFDVVPRSRLLLFDLVDDPRYEGMEVQRLDDPAQGSGLVVLLFRHDRKVDVFHEPTVRLDREGFAVGAGVGEWVEATIEPRRFELRDDGAHVELGLHDAHGDRIEIIIEESDSRRRHPEVLLAPVSAEIEQPSSLPLVYLRGFDFVHRAGRFEVRVGDQLRSVATMPVPIDYSRCYMARYSADPVVVELGRRSEGVVPRADALDEQHTAELDGDGAIVALGALGPRHRARLGFEPAFPDLRRLEGITEGSWRIDIDDDLGVIAGTYAATRRGDEVELALDVTQGWEPHGLKPSFVVMTTVMRAFRTWPKSYHWRGRVDLSGETITRAGEWIRGERESLRLIGTPHRFVIERRMAVDPERLWARVSDFEAHDDPRVELEHEGDPARGGLGALRRVRVGSHVVRERLVDRRPERSLTYELVEGAPVRNYFGTVEVATADDDPGASILRWEVRFEPRLPGTAWLVEWIARRTLGEILDGLEDELRVPAPRA